jgi:hypothetical protein
MSIGKLRGPALRFLQGRLERLQESLEVLAGLVGAHVGDAVRDALRPALGRPRPAPAEPWDWPEQNYAAPDDDPHEYRPAPMWDHEPAPPPAVPAAPAPKARPGWRSLLAGGLQLAGWWLREKARRPLLRWLGLGAVVSLALAGGPVTAGVLAAVGVAAALTALADGTAATAGTLAGVSSS